jgi:PLP dependent protein
MITDNVKRVKARIAAACGRVNRDPAGVTLVAVTKGRPLEDILQIVEAGIFDIGENRVHEALEKYRVLGNAMKDRTPVRWHMIGHLQTNKVTDAVAFSALIHSVDSLKLAQEIDTQAAKIRKIQDILIEVKTSHEEAKYGIHPSALPGLIAAISPLRSVRLKGLMTMAPAGNTAGSARPYFRSLKEIRGAHNAMQELSMGMSGDFEEAVEEGATIVRIGRALFEE